MKGKLALSLLAMSLAVGAAHGAAVRYYFNGAMTNNITGSGVTGLTASDITWNTSLTPATSQLGYYAAAGVTSQVFAVDQSETATRGAPDDAPAGSTSGYFEFTLHIDAGYQLDTSNMGWSLDLWALNDGDTRERTTHGVWASVDGGATFTNLWNNAGGDGFDTGNPAPALSGTLNQLDDTQLMAVTHGQKFTPSGKDWGNLGLLADGQDITFRVVLGDSDAAMYTAFDQLAITSLTATNSAPPSLPSDPYVAATGYQGTPYSFDLSAVATAAGTITNYAKESGASWINVETNGVIYGTPDVLGTSTVSVIMMDDLGFSGTNTVQIPIIANTPPAWDAATNVVANADEGVAYTNDLSVFVTDPDGSVLTFMKLGESPGLNNNADMWSVSTNGLLTGTPTKSSEGIMYVEVEVSDGIASDTAVIQITVNDTIPAPTGLPWVEDFDVPITLIQDNSADVGPLPVGEGYSASAYGTWFRNAVEADAPVQQFTPTGGVVYVQARENSNNSRKGHTRGVSLVLDGSILPAGQTANLSLDILAYNDADSRLMVDVHSVNETNAPAAYKVPSSTSNRNVPLPDPSAITNCVVSQLVAGDQLFSNEVGTVEVSFTIPEDCDAIIVQFGCMTPDTANNRYVVIDNLEIDIAVGYEAWATANGVTGGPDAMHPTYGITNYEVYGLGLIGADNGELPEFGGDGMGGLIYVHAQRADDPSVSYSLRLTGNLVHGPWTTNTGYTVTGTNVTGGTIDFVTNAIPTLDDQKFIDLLIE